MHRAVRVTYYVFLVITILTAVVALSGLCQLWFLSESPEDLPHLKWLLGIVIAEVIGVVLMIAKRGLRYLPKIVTNKTESDTMRFMQGFIGSGTSVCIVSNRVSWLARSSELMEMMKRLVQNGVRIEIITPVQVQESIKTPLESAGVHFCVTKESYPPESRFTLINADRAGAEKLAIARGVHPEHEVTVFDMSSGPQIIGMAKDIVRKSRELSDAQ